MKKILIVLAVVLMFHTGIGLAASTKAEPEPLQVIEIVEKQVEPILNHQQDTWVRALEWCESNGVESSVNWHDKDGTPSYYSFQFKPGTFRDYGEKYGLIPKGLTDKQIMEKMKSFELQYKIVARMVNDPKVKWSREFPDCVKKLGRPPVIHKDTHSKP